MSFTVFYNYILLVDKIDFMTIIATILYIYICILLQMITKIHQEMKKISIWNKYCKLKMIVLSS